MMLPTQYISAKGWTRKLYLQANDDTEIRKTFLYKLLFYTESDNGKGNDNANIKECFQLP